GVVMMMFFHNEKVKNIGEILCGLGLLFFGLAVMKDAFSNEDMNAACVTMFSAINFPPLLFLIGVLLTALAQSSSAITGITIAMVGGGALDLSSALYIALGATLGTVATTLLASMSGNIEGKRAATTAFAMRALSSVVALVILWIFETPITEFLHLMAINGSDQFPVAMFTVIYNVIFMPLMIPLIKPFTKLFTRILKDKKASEFADAVQYIDDRLLKSPEIALMQARKEIVHMFDLAETNYHNGFEKILNYSDEKTKEIINIEGQVDYLNARITDFLIKLAPLLQTSSEVKVGAYFHVINDIERIGDHAFNFHEAADAMNQEDLSFSETAKKEIKELDAVVTNMFKIAREIFINKDRSSLTVLRDQEEDTHRMKQDFYQHHYDRILAEQCSTKMTPYISSFIVELERVADHLTNIGYSIVRPTGDTMEATSPEDAKKLKRKAKAAK
ncbi:MAG: Na/Pi symporter, partial [Bacilli bacterium]|nr:Na/Pi symporter [Bacilli bacterium]